MTLRAAALLRHLPCTPTASPLVPAPAASRANRSFDGPTHGADEARSRRAPTDDRTRRPERTDRAEQCRPPGEGVVENQDVLAGDVTKQYEPVGPKFVLGPAARRARRRLMSLVQHPDRDTIGSTSALAGDGTVTTESNSPTHGAPGTATSEARRRVMRVRTAGLRSAMMGPARAAA